MRCRFFRKFFIVNYLMMAVTPLAVADENEWNDQQQWYAGLRAGYSSNENSCRDTRISCDKTDTGYGVFGGYTFNERYGLEISWNDIGDSHAQYQDLKLTGELAQADVSLRISHPLNADLLAYGKIGAAYWDGKVTGGFRELTDSGVRPLLGAGVEFPFASSWAFRVEYQYIDKVGNSAMGFSNPNFIGIALVWKGLSFAGMQP